MSSPAEKPKVSENERKVLEALAEAYSSPDDWGAYAFKALSAITELEIAQVRRACRSLAKKGLAQFERVLWDMDEFHPAGAGYRATESGAAFISPCDLCQKRATYDYHLDEKGEHTWGTRTARHIRECEQHYKQSAERPVQVKFVTA